MPIFEYRCDDCGTRFERLVKASTKVEELECPSCGEHHLQQELSTFAAHSGVKSQTTAPTPGGCPAGICRTPGMCGRN